MADDYLEDLRSMGLLDEEEEAQIHEIMKKRSNVSNENPPRKPSGRPKPRKRRKKFIGWIILLAAIVLTLVVLAVVLGGNKTDESIIGRWDLDGDTVYIFREGGEGTLVLPSMRFDFDYKISKNTVSIDFEDERARDSVYDYTIIDGVLILDGGNSEARGEYVLVRKKR